MRKQTGVKLKVTSDLLEKKTDRACCVEVYEIVKLHKDARNIECKIHYKVSEYT